jgi:hypothetical protein
MDNFDSTAYTSINQLLITSVPYDGDKISFQNVKLAHNFLLYLVTLKIQILYHYMTLSLGLEHRILCEIIKQFIFPFSFNYSVLDTTVPDIHTFSVLSVNARPD